MVATLAVDADRVARVHQALADPTRVRILEVLASGEHCVCELTGLLGSAQSRLSFHLRTLRDAGLVQARRSGRWMYYALDRDVLTGAGSYLAELVERSKAPMSGPCCGEAGGCCH